MPFSLWSEASTSERLEVGLWFCGRVVALACVYVHVRIARPERFCDINMIKKETLSFSRPSFDFVG